MKLNQKTPLDSQKSLIHHWVKDGYNGADTTYLDFNKHKLYYKSVNQLYTDLGFYDLHLFHIGHKYTNFYLYGIYDALSSDTRKNEPGVLSPLGSKDSDIISKKMVNSLKNIENTLFSIKDTEINGENSNLGYIINILKSRHNLYIRDLCYNMAILDNCMKDIAKNSTLSLKEDIFPNNKYPTLPYPPLVDDNEVIESPDIVGDIIDSNSKPPKPSLPVEEDKDNENIENSTDQENSNESSTDTETEITPVPTPEDGHTELPSDGTTNEGTDGIKDNEIPVNPSEDDMVTDVLPPTIEEENKVDTSLEESTGESSDIQQGEVSKDEQTSLESVGPEEPQISNGEENVEPTVQDSGISEEGSEKTPIEDPNTVESDTEETPPKSKVEENSDGSVSISMIFERKTDKEIIEAAKNLLSKVLEEEKEHEVTEEEVFNIAEFMENHMFTVIKEGLSKGKERIEFFEPPRHNSTRNIRMANTIVQSDKQIEMLYALANIVNIKNTLFGYIERNNFDYSYEYLFTIYTDMKLLLANYFAYRYYELSNSSIIDKIKSLL